MVRGLLQWRAAQQFPGGIAENEAALERIDQQLAEIDSRKQKIKDINTTGSDLQPLSSRIEQQQQQLQRQLQQVDAAIALRGDQLQQQVDKQLQVHEKRLNRYLSQAHLAVARLYDSAIGKPAQ